MNGKHMMLLLAGLVGAALALTVLTRRAPAPAQAEPAEELLALRTLVLEEDKIPEEDRFLLYDQATGETFSLPGRQLLPVTLACETDLAAPREAIKAQAVADYTRFCRCRENGEAIPCHSESQWVWTTETALRERWGDDWETKLAGLREIVEEVYGQTLVWEGEPILAASCAISAGTTESAKALWGLDLPYLTPVISPGDPLCQGYLSEAELSPRELAARLEKAFPERTFDWTEPAEDWLTVEEHSQGDYVHAVTAGGEALTGTQFSEALGLRSTCFTVEVGELFRFVVRGWGQGLGMSRAGAVFLAQEGLDYADILAYYYPGVQLAAP